MTRSKTLRERALEEMRFPRKCKALNCAKGWYYVNKTNIDVLSAPAEQCASHVVLTRRQLEHALELMRRAAKREKRKP